MFSEKTVIHDVFIPVK